MVKSSAINLIVLADDHEDSLECLAVLLESEGYSVATATNGQQAIELVQTLIPQAILLDLAMPVMNGFQAAQSIRMDSRFKTIYIAAVTGHADEPTLRRVAEGGFDAHFLKPLDYERLFGALRAALHKPKS